MLLSPIENFWDCRMNYYPANILTLNRYEHFCNRMESSYKGLFWRGWETTRFAKFMTWEKK